MSSYTEDVLGIKIDGDGSKSLRGASFSKQEFGELVFGPAASVGTDYLIEDCTLEDCRVNGTYMVTKGVTLRRVRFHSVMSPDMFTISTSTVLDHVVISGSSKARGVWVKPFETLSERDAAFQKWAQAQWANVEMMLDISQYVGAEVEILGLPLEKVILNPARHVALRRIWTGRLDWKELGIGPKSFWRIRLMGIDDFSVDSAIFDLPLPGERKYQEAMDDLPKLREAGIVQ